MRWLPYLLVVLGLIFLVDAGYDEQREVADVRSPTRSGRRYVIARAEDPKQFRNLMHYQWFRGPILICGGFIILGFCRRADRLDPFSPDFAGSDKLDELHRQLTQEEERRRRPLK